MYSPCSKADNKKKVRSPLLFFFLSLCQQDNAKTPNPNVHSKKFLYNLRKMLFCDRYKNFKLSFTSFKVFVSIKLVFFVLFTPCSKKFEVQNSPLLSAALSLI